MAETQRRFGDRRTERITIAVTPKELGAARYVARVQETDEGPLVRELAFAKILREYRRLTAIQREEPVR